MMVISIFFFRKNWLAHNFQCFINYTMQGWNLNDIEGGHLEIMTKIMCKKCCFNKSVGFSLPLNQCKFDKISLINASLP
jgi:hypothetical protein